MLPVLLSLTFKCTILIPPVFWHLLYSHLFSEIWCGSRSGRCSALSNRIAALVIAPQHFHFAGCFCLPCLWSTPLLLAKRGHGTISPFVCFMKRHHLLCPVPYAAIWWGWVTQVTSVPEPCSLKHLFAYFITLGTSTSTAQHSSSYIFHNAAFKSHVYEELMLPWVSVSPGISFSSQCGLL